MAGGVKRSVNCSSMTHKSFYIAYYIRASDVVRKWIDNWTFSLGWPSTLLVVCDSLLYASFRATVNLWYCRGVCLLFYFLLLVGLCMNIQSKFRFRVKVVSLQFMSKVTEMSKHAEKNTLRINNVFSLYGDLNLFAVLYLAWYSNVEYVIEF